MSAFVVYPREYVPDEETVYGVDESGRSWRVVLDVPDDVRGRSRGDVPSVELFAETGRRAKSPCLADKENGPEAPSGMLLAERCEMAEDDEGRYVRCGWMSNLRMDDAEPLPVLGVGYLEVSAWARRGELRALREARDLPREERAREVRRWREKLPYSFTGVVMAFGRTIEIGDGRDGVDAGLLVDAVAPYFRSGHRGGALLRVEVGDQVDMRSSAVLRPRWLTDTERSEDADEMVDRFLASDAGRAFAQRARDARLVAVPTLRIAAGPMFTQSLRGEIARSADGGKNERIWLEREYQGTTLLDAVRLFGHRATKVAVRRVALRAGDGAEGENLGMSGMYCCSAPLGNALLLEQQEDGVKETLAPLSTPQGGRQSNGRDRRESRNAGRTNYSR